MSIKILIKYLLLYFLFLLGMILYYVGLVNLFSSLLLFLGGYIAIKNTFDYRLVRKNISSIKKDSDDNHLIELDKEQDKKNERQVIRQINCDDVVGVKRVRSYSRVRKKY